MTQLIIHILMFKPTIAFLKKDEIQTVRVMGEDGLLLSVMHELTLPSRVH